MPISCLHRNCLFWRSQFTIARPQRHTPPISAIECLLYSRIWIPRGSAHQGGDNAFFRSVIRSTINQYKENPFFDKMFFHKGLIFFWQVGNSMLGGWCRRLHVRGQLTAFFSDKGMTYYCLVLVPWLSFPLYSMAFEMLPISSNICTAFAEVFLCINSADQLKVELTGQVIFTCPVPVGSIR
jgi:hypothetical protein